MTRRRKRLFSIAFVSSAIWAVALLAISFQACVSDSRSMEASDRIVLENGLTVFLYPVPEADQVAIESICRVGFLHEPRGIPQAAHLLEHLMCQAATKTYAPGESLALLNQKGMANAETLADFTHYDYVVPSGDLELALKIEAERLTSLKITPQIIRQEAPRCHQEALFVEQSPQAGMLKFAFNAFSQAWRYGATDVRVKSGLQNVAPEALASFYRDSYVPGNLLLVLVGGFDRDSALKLIQKHLGSIHPSQLPPPSPVLWTKVSEDMSVRWDSKVRAVCIAFPPPEGAADRSALSLWGGLLMQKLMSDPDIQAAADSVFCSNPSWSVGTLPFFLYATAKPGTSVADLTNLLASRLQTTRSQKPAALEVMQLKLMANQFTQSPVPDWNTITQQSNMLASQLGADPKRAVGMVLGNIALLSGARESLLGPQPEDSARKLQQLTADNLHSIIQRSLDPSRQFVTILTPLEEVRQPGRAAGRSSRGR